jgi:hypothetical protein
MLTIPGVFCWSIANLIQKFHEVTSRTQRMAMFLGIGATVFAGICLLIGGLRLGNSQLSEVDLSAAFSIGFAVYLLLLSGDVLRMSHVASRNALCRVRLVFVSSIGIIGSFTLGMIAFHLSKLR